MTLRTLLLLVSSVLVTIASPAGAAEREMSATENVEQVAQWNRFADAVLALHDHYVATRKVRIERKPMPYGGELARKFRYTEMSVFDASSGAILSRMIWENEKARRAQSMEVLIYDSDGVLVRDYALTYIPGHRNAPFQTWINLHQRSDGLQAFRQFDASGARIYEQCKGEYGGRKIWISLPEYEIPDDVWQQDAIYLACFSSLPTAVGEYINPLNELRRSTSERTDSLYVSTEILERRIAQLDARLALTPGDTVALIKRGDTWLQMQEFDKAVSDYTRAIALDRSLDDAWFGRGMALARGGKIKEGIADLTVYLERNPDSSKGYTKRGVRHIWNGDMAAAKGDLLKAVALDASNAEAHDDLGVVYASEKNYSKAADHFQKSIDNDATYQKAWHNLALVHHLTGKDRLALEKVDRAMVLDPENRSTALLKAAVLESMGRADEARKWREKAAYLPEGNWSERLNLN